MSPTEQARWFAEEVKPHEPILRGYLSKRFPSLPNHDDIVQEAYARLWHARTKSRLSSAKGFLFTAARNLAIDTLRRRQAVTHESISEVTQMPALEEAPGVAESLERQQRLQVLNEAIASLPTRCREVLVLRHLDGLAYKEIAERLGISPNTVKLHIIKGMRDCAAYFRAQGLLDPSETPRRAAPSEPVAP
jgi:RNA polymerase sigma-70 factor (ECF subfamily)